MSENNNFLSLKLDQIFYAGQQYSPRSHKVLRIGPDAPQDQVISAVRNHIFSTITNYEIPDPLAQRFRWLSMGDVKVQQELLNHFLDIEKEEAVNGTQVQLPVMLKHLRESGDIIHRLNQKIKIGKHEFDLAFDKTASGVAFEEPHSAIYRSSEKSWTWLWWVLGIGFLLYLFRS